MKYDGIRIVGSQKFIKQTVKAIKIIRNSKKDYDFIRKYLRSIKSAKSSGMDLAKGEFNVGKQTAFCSYIEWYASTIVHDTYHYYLHSTKRLIWTEKNYRKHEELSVLRQISFLKRIHAPKELIQHCKIMIKTEYWKIPKKDW